MLKRQNAIKIFLLTSFFLLAIWNLKNVSITLDGCKHLEKGLRYIETGSCCEGTDNTPLTVINSAPAYFLNKYYNVDVSCKEETQPFLYRYLPNRFLVFIIGLPTVLIGLIGGFYAYKFASELFDQKVGIIALFFYAFNPNIIAYSTINSQDALVSVMSLIAVYYFYLLYKRNTLGSVIISGLTLGLALSSKLNAALLVISYIIIYYLHYLFSKKNISFKHLFFIFLTAYFVLNVIYRFEGTFNPASLYWDNFKSSLFLKLKNVWPRELPLFFPIGYLKGLDNIIFNNSEGWGNYLFGKYIPTGSAWYFLMVFLIKTPIPTLILFIIFFFQKNKKFNETFLFIPLMIFLLFNFFLNRLALGLRFLLVLYPFIFILNSHTIINIWKSKSILVYALLIWYFIGTVRYRPHYLAYFNEFTGGPFNGYKYLADSNIDWGQEGFLIEDYIKKAKFQIKKNPGCKYTSGIIAINVNSLAGISGNPSQEDYCYSWIKNFPIIDRVGYTWFIYKIE